MVSRDLVDGGKSRPGAVGVTDKSPMSSDLLPTPPSSQCMAFDHNESNLPFQRARDFRLNRGRHWQTSREALNPRTDHARLRTPCRSQFAILAAHWPGPIGYGGAQSRPQAHLGARPASIREQDPHGALTEA